MRHEQPAQHLLAGECGRRGREQQRLERRDQADREEDDGAHAARRSRQRERGGLKRPAHDPVASVEHHERVAHDAAHDARGDHDHAVEDREPPQLLDAQQPRHEHLQHEADAGLRPLGQERTESARDHPAVVLSFISLP
ncbi:hypothetical protein GCM10025869_33180 [Homoserinibacter gongjuensis]|uniref:Uncharacterized protein n=1 Tax=Homoserinibacter gongjuensis TaxID=1162968 RepID=A0ABQ6JXP2_9MICO|nr:hypothetical protein GCM10025869_33180 [Homoserinibacter gongjuensis]